MSVNVINPVILVSIQTINCEWEKGLADFTAEATGDLIGNKIADKITSLGKTMLEKRMEKKKGKEEQEIYILPEKRQQIIDDLRLF